MSEFEVENSKSLPSRRTGLALPLVDNRRGGLRLVSGPENDFKIISLAVMSNASSNAFQQPTVDIDEAIFALDDVILRAMVRRKLERVFAEFAKQHRYSLIEGSLQFNTEVPGTVAVNFKYHNIEADKIDDISIELGSN